jgi:hypothetical protein
MHQAKGGHFLYVPIRHDLDGRRLLRNFETHEDSFAAVRSLDDVRAIQLPQKKAFLLVADDQLLDGCPLEA